MITFAFLKIHTSGFPNFLMGTSESLTLNFLGDTLVGNIMPSQPFLLPRKILQNLSPQGSPRLAKHPTFNWGRAIGYPFIRRSGKLIPPHTFIY
ncbi:unnamed protein product [Prunus armeniaca]